MSNIKSHVCIKVSTSDFDVVKFKKIIKEESLELVSYTLHEAETEESHVMLVLETTINAK